MRTMLGNWKYLFKNIWYVLPCGLLPAIFLALSFDYTATGEYVTSFFTGEPRVDFVTLFRVWCPLRIDSWLGGVYSICAFVLLVVCATLLLSIVEKHMRIGKRTLHGIGSAFARMILPVFLVLLMYTAFGVLWALVLSALLYAINALASTVLVYFLSVLGFLVTGFAFLYLLEVFYLWLPCMQITSFRPYDAFLYAYRLAAGVRWKLLGAHLISFLVLIAALGASVILQDIFFRLIAFVLCVFLFLSFFIRMETVYYETDKLDREDVLKSYREL